MDSIAIPLLIIMTALSIPIFSFLAVAKWAQERRREREAFYLSETLKKLADSSTTTPAEFLREHERNNAGRSREAMRLWGLIGTFAATALCVAVWAGSPGRGYLITLIPLSACVALFVYAQFLAPRE